jgi:prephenate dehydrogenase
VSTWNTVAIIGVGLIGGSIGLATRRRGLCGRVVGIGRDATRLRQAKRLGAVTEIVTSVEKGVRDADLVVVCTPVDSIPQFVLRAAASCKRPTLITDTGSTKASIVGRVERAVAHPASFVGSHPLAGGEQSGVASAREDLFEGRAVVVTPTRRTRQGDVDAVSGFWSALGGRVWSMTPQAHDKAVAVTSHLPHVAAAALAANTPIAVSHLVAGGWLDTTRVAAGDAELWAQILLDNRQHVSQAVRAHQNTMERFFQALNRGNKKELLRLLTAGQRRRNALGS